MDTSKVKVVTNRPAPKRKTQPSSKWRELLTPMKRGHWFEVKCNTQDKTYNRVCAAANTYCRGRYTFYKIAKGRYVFEINKG
jgi:hypothetical protein